MVSGTTVASPGQGLMARAELEGGPGPWAGVGEGPRGGLAGTVRANGALRAVALGFTARSSLSR